METIQEENNRIRCCILSSTSLISPHLSISQALTYIPVALTVEHLRTTPKCLEERWLKENCPQYSLLVCKKLYIYNSKYSEAWILALFQLLIPMPKNIAVPVDTVIITKPLCH